MEKGKGMLGERMLQGEMTLDVVLRLALYELDFKFYIGFSM